MSRPLRDLDGADPYELLGVSADATAREVTEAYKRRMRQVHPDLSPGDRHAEQTAKLLNVAREVLLDPRLRRTYDELVARGVDPAEEIVDEPPPTSAWDADDVVSGPARPAPGPRHPSGPPRYPAPPHSAPPYPGPAYSAPLYFGPPPAGPPHQGPSLAPPAYHPYTPPPHRPGGLSLGVWALISTALCGPVGLVLGIVALSRRPPKGSADRICAIVAIGWSVLALACCAGYFVFVVTSSGAPQ